MPIKKLEIKKNCVAEEPKAMKWIYRMHRQGG